MLHCTLIYTNPRVFRRYVLQYHNLFLMPLNIIYNHPSKPASLALTKENIKSMADCVLSLVSLTNLATNRIPNEQQPVKTPNTHVSLS
jgi:hypothetical protein